MTKKVILPAEVKVCATCCYWDGERQVDGEMQVVVVSEDCKGECMVVESQAHALTDTRTVSECQWDNLGPDDFSLASIAQPKPAKGPSL